MSVTANDIKRNYPVPNSIDKKLAIDIGSNIGGFSMAYNQVFEKILFFEANPSAYEISKKNTETYSNVSGYNLAVSDTSDKTIKLMNHFSKDLGSVTCSPSITETKMADWNEDIGVIKTISLKDIFNLIDNQRINFLKMDCENSEYEILLGKDLSKIDYMAMELHWQMGESKYNELVEYLKTYFSINGDISFKKDRNVVLELTKL